MFGDQIRCIKTAESDVIMEHIFKKLSWEQANVHTPCRKNTTVIQDNIQTQLLWTEHEWTSLGETK